MIGRDVRVSMVAVAQGNLTVTISETPEVVSRHRSRAWLDQSCAAHQHWRPGGRQENVRGQRRRIPATGRRRPQRHGHRTARSDYHPASNKGSGRDPGRHRGDVMASAFALSAPGLKPLDLLTNSTAPDKLNSVKQTKARAAAQDFEAVFLTPCFSTCSPASAVKGHSAAVARPGSGARCSRTSTPGHSQNRAG